jgi:hypothetical protein
MNQSATQWSPSTAEISLGTVKSILDDTYLTVDAYGRCAKAKKAASCLLSPIVQDVVLLAAAGEKVFVLSVLERRNADTSTISLEGDVRMSVPDGAFRVAAKAGVALETPETLSLSAGRMDLAGHALNAAFENIQVVGEAVEAGLLHLKLFSKRMESKVESAVMRFVSRHAEVTGLDSVKAGNIRQTAENLLSLRSSFSFLKAKKNVKIDGKQILMG